MTRTNLLASVGTLAALVAGPAFAAGTTAGSTIQNDVTVSYTVGGAAQTPRTASNTFTVDRKVSLTVTEPGNATTVVAPNQTGVYTTFLITNTSNAPLDFALTGTQASGGPAPHGGTDTFDVTGVTFYVDTDASGTFTAGDTAVTYLDELAADASRTVFAVASIPLGETTGEVASITLTAQAREAGTSGTQGAVVTQTSGANTAGMDTVFADTAGFADAARDGQFSARDDYTVAAAALSVVKTSTIISDPLNGTTNPKLIPGATVGYCIQVSNAAGSATATAPSIADTLPTMTSYDSATGIRVNGTVTSGVCNADGTAGGSFASGIVSGTLSDIAAGQTRTLYFRVTIN